MAALSSETSSLRRGIILARPFQWARACPAQVPSVGTGHPQYLPVFTPRRSPGTTTTALRGSLKAANVLLCVGCALRGREALRTSLVWGEEGHPCGMKPAGHEPSEKTGSPLQGPLLLMFGFVSSSTVSISFPCKHSNDVLTRSS